MTDRYFPPMPETEDEWRCHVAFYRLAIIERDAAWRQIETLKESLRLALRMIDGASDA